MVHECRVFRFFLHFAIGMQIIFLLFLLLFFKKKYHLNTSSPTSPTLLSNLYIRVAFCRQLPAGFSARLPLAGCSEVLQLSPAQPQRTHARTHARATLRPRPCLNPKFPKTSPFLTSSLSSALPCLHPFFAGSRTSWHDVSWPTLLTTLLYPTLRHCPLHIDDI